MKIFKRQKQFREEEIIQILGSGGKQEGEVLRQLYNTHFNSIQQLILRQGGDEQEAEDIFQDALITFYEQVKNGRYTRTATIKTYLYTIAKNNWINKLKRKNRSLDLGAIEWHHEENDEPSPNDLLLQQEVIDFAQSIMSQLGADCQRILELSLYKKVAMNEIAEMMQFSNAQVARNKKYKCLERLKKIILESAKLSRLAKELKNE